MSIDLKGIKIVQAAWAIASPIACRLLADWGAEVIAIDSTTKKPQMVEARAREKAYARTVQSDIDYSAQTLQSNKRNLILNLTTDGGREIIYKLIKNSDVFVSNFRPYELEKFKLEYETVNKFNPKLIYANLTGYGRKGADKNLPGFGSCLDARAGVLHAMQVPGNEPPRLPYGVTDCVTGLSLAFGIVAALLMRERTGIGQEVDVSLFNTMTWVQSINVSGALVTGEEIRAMARKDRTTPLISHYETKDGRWLNLTLPQPERYWSKLCQALERKDLEHDPRFASAMLITKNRIALLNILDETFKTKTLEEWKPRLNESGVPWAPAQTYLEVIKDPQARANDFFVSFEVPEHGRIEIMSNPVKLSKSPASIRRSAPEPGQHTEEILSELGYKQKDIKQLLEQNVVQN